MTLTTPKLVVEAAKFDNLLFIIVEQIERYFLWAIKNYFES